MCEIDYAYPMIRVHPVHYVYLTVRRMMITTNCKLPISHPRQAVVVRGNKIYGDMNEYLNIKCVCEQLNNIQSSYNGK